MTARERTRVHVGRGSEELAPACTVDALEQTGPLQARVTGSFEGVKLKECPVCHAMCFSDMEMCYGCLHSFKEDGAGLKATSASGEDGKIVADSQMEVGAFEESVAHDLGIKVLVPAAGRSQTIKLKRKAGAANAGMANADATNVGAVNADTANAGMAKAGVANANEVLEVVLSVRMPQEQ